MAKITAAGSYCMYLRRSRADIEEEQRGAGNTLARHYARLTELAERLGISIPQSAVYREIVSGDTIAERPQMKRLLADVEAGKWTGVLVTEMSRLARGDTVDQGIVANTFLYSNTLIITPQKTYDLRDQSDEGRDGPVHGPLRVPPDQAAAPGRARQLRQAGPLHRQPRPLRLQALQAPPAARLQLGDRAGAGGDRAHGL